ncbi:alpha/beta hydrolase [Pseudotabrizicola sp.]|uniref:alpha/beta hydrolase n=1 Tax=Pseudotabrizicola sp. TaxID=2939647 RepID=UPI0027282D74|nr:alpha/beta hydrolase [Pseudotabrizicola sp.]MDO8884258.1 alpha/beta hydrolase [Pseudotabrizicola sp.]
MSRSQPSPDMAAILARLAAEDAGLPDPTQLPAAQGRAQAAQANARWNHDLPDMVQVSEVLAQGPAGPLPCRVLVPHGPVRGTILYLHGGGWAFCDRDTHDRATRVLAQEAGAVVVSADYSLAPEHPFPAGLEDARAIWAALCAGDVPFAGLTRPLAISGDSAGANIALAVLLDKAAPRADCALLFYGVYGADFTSPSYTAFADGPGLTRAKMQRYWDWYAPQTPRHDPQLAPLLAPDAALADLPPLYLNAAEIDPLRSDTERLYARLMALGRADRFRLHGGVVHGFMQMSLELEEARRALADAGAAFRSLTSQPSRNITKRERDT